eukprot:724545-Prymnesium_polylepis.2
MPVLRPSSALAVLNFSLVPSLRRDPRMHGTRATLTIMIFTPAKHLPRHMPDTLLNTDHVECAYAGL